MSTGRPEFGLSRSSTFSTTSAGGRTAPASARTRWAWLLLFFRTTSVRKVMRQRARGYTRTPTPRLGAWLLYGMDRARGHIHWTFLLKPLMDPHSTPPTILPFLLMGVMGILCSAALRPGAPYTLLEWCLVTRGRETKSARKRTLFCRSKRRTTPTPLTSVHAFCWWSLR